MFQNKATHHTLGEKKKDKNNPKWLFSFGGGVVFLFCFFSITASPEVQSGAVSTDDRHVLWWRLSCLQDIP